MVSATDPMIIVLIFLGIVIGLLLSFRYFWKRAGSAERLERKELKEERDLFESETEEAETLAEEFKEQEIEKQLEGTGATKAQQLYVYLYKLSNGIEHTKKQAEQYPNQVRLLANPLIKAVPNAIALANQLIEIQEKELEAAEKTQETFEKEDEELKEQKQLTVKLKKQTLKEEKKDKQTAKKAEKKLKKR